MKKQQNILDFIEASSVALTAGNITITTITL
jgi:hypothetical protein